VLLKGLGGDLVSEVAEFELGRPKGMSVVGGDESSGEFLDFRFGGLADGLCKGLDVGVLVGGQRGGRHEVASVARGRFQSTQRTRPFVYKDSTNFQDAHRPGWDGEFSS
jgi:hypothetical protein